MKKLFASLLIFSALGAHAQIPRVWFTNALMVDTTNDTTINIKAVKNPVGFGNSIYRLPPQGTNITTVDGVASIRLVPNDYTIAYAGIAQSWTIHVTNSAADLNALDLTSNLTRYSGVETLRGFGSITIIPPTGAGGAWGVSNNASTGSGLGDVTGPGVSTIGEIPFFDQITGQHLGRSGIQYSNVSPWANLNTNTYGIAVSNLAGAPRPIFAQTITNITAGTNMGGVTQTTAANGQRSFKVDGITDTQFKAMYSANVVDMLPQSDFDTFLTAPSFTGDMNMGSHDIASARRIQVDGGYIGNQDSGAEAFDLNNDGSARFANGLATIDTNGNFTASGGFITNGGIVLYYTNGAPQVALPNGSHCFQSNGQEWSRTNNAWVAINITGTGTGGSGTVTSVDVAKSGHTSSGAVTSSGTITLTRTGVEDFGNKGVTNLGFFTMGVWRGYTNPANGSLNFSNLTGGNVALTLLTNNTLAFNGQAVTNLQATNVTGLVQVDAASSTNAYAAFDSSGQLVGTRNGGSPGWTNLSSTNIVLDTSTLAPTSNATNYTSWLVTVPGSHVIYSANTNINLTLTGTNLADVNRTLFVDNSTGAVNCNLTFTFSYRTNTSFSAVVSNGWDGVFSLSTVRTSGVVRVFDAGRSH